MFVGLAAFGTYSYFSRPASTERQYFEADASGRLVRVDRPTSSVQQEPKLWKPEPQLLLRNKGELELSAAQIERIESVQSTWELTKANLERQIEVYAKPFEQSGKKRLSFATATTGLAGYSELSRQFARRRDSAWKSAMAVLDEHQRDLLERLRKTSEVRQ